MSDSSIRLDGEVTIYQAAALRESLMEQFALLPAIELDLSAVAEMDTAGLQLVLAAKAEALHANKPFRVSAISDSVRDLLALYAIPPEDIHLERVA
ncbi:MAG: STAS domain-containing protein [Pseudomonadota bacterium]